MLDVRREERHDPVKGNPKQNLLIHHRK